MKTYKLLLFPLFISLIVNPSFSQEKNKKSAVETALKGFKFRSVGPAFMAGRIADIAIDLKMKTHGTLLQVLAVHGKPITQELPGLL